MEKKKKGPTTLDQSLLIKVSLVLSRGSCSPHPPFPSPSLPQGRRVQAGFRLDHSSGELAMSGTRFSHLSLFLDSQTDDP